MLEELIKLVLTVQEQIFAAFFSALTEPIQAGL